MAPAIGCQKDTTRQWLGASALACVAAALVCDADDRISVEDCQQRRERLHQHANGIIIFNGDGAWTTAGVSDRRSVQQSQMAHHYRG
jgi:hypothetical protein